MHPKWVVNWLSNAHLTHFTFGESIASGSVPAPTSTLVQDPSSQYQMTLKSPFSHPLGLVGRTTYFQKGLLALQTILQSSWATALLEDLLHRKLRYSHPGEEMTCEEYDIKSGGTFGL